MNIRFDGMVNMNELLLLLILAVAWAIIVIIVLNSILEKRKHAPSKYSKASVFKRGRNRYKDRTRKGRKFWS